jgi:hypothetical protein
MVSFAFTTILMVCLASVLYLTVRALPRIAEEPSADGSGGFLDRWARSEIPEKVDAAVNSFLLKFLRKVKVVVLKLDNQLAKHLQKITKDGTEKKSNIDFKEIAGQNKEGEE